MADLFHFLSDVEDDVRAVEDLSALLLLVHEDQRDTFTPAEAAGVMRVLYLQADHARTLSAKWAASYEAVMEVARRTRHG